MVVSVDFLIAWTVLVLVVGYFAGRFVNRNAANTGRSDSGCMTKPYLDCPMIPYERDVSAKVCRNCGEITAHGYIAARGVYVCKICRCETKKY